MQPCRIHSEPVLAGLREPDPIVQPYMENKWHLVERMFAASPTADISVSEQIRQRIDETSGRSNVVLLCKQSSGAVVGFGRKVVVATRLAAKFQFQRDL